jgi:hypothetical protein
MERSLSDAVAFVIDCIRRLALNTKASRVSQFDAVLHNRDGTSRGLIAPDNPDFQVACEALRDVKQLEFFFDQVDITTESQEMKAKVKLATKDPVLPQHGSPESPGRDAQAELFVFGVCRKAELKPVFQEPDIVCTFNRQTVPIAVKRVKNLKQLVKRIKEGADQVARVGDLGIIFVDVVIAMNPKNHRVIAKVPDSVFGLMWTKLLKQLVDGHHAKIQGAIRDKGVLGVILHDHWVRMDARDHWRLETMTYGVPAHNVDSSLHNRFTAFIDRYIGALPHLTRITRQ